MNPVLPDEAVEFGAAAAHAFADLGGVDLAREAELDPSMRTTKVAGVLAALGVDDLDPRADPDSLAAAAVLCETAGRVALPYPVASALLRDGDGRPFAAVPDGVARVDHGDLFGSWVVATAAGGAHTAKDGGAPLGTRLGPFVTDLAPIGDASGGAGVHPDVPVHLALTSYGVLGTVAAAVDAAVEHVQGRVQFGKPIAAFQAVQFMLADCAVAVEGLRQLGAFTLWRLGDDPVAAFGDALALRLHAVDVARSVLRTTQQLHGAAGVCDEYDISVLARMVQPALRLPWSAERTATLLADTITTDGFLGLFPHGNRPTDRPSASEPGGDGARAQRAGAQPPARDGAGGR